MTLADLSSRESELQQSLINVQQSYHILTGHLHEVQFQIKKLKESEQSIENDESNEIE